jgi:hypothetical protein
MHFSSSFKPKLLAFGKDWYSSKDLGNYARLAGWFVLLDPE